MHKIIQLNLHSFVSITFLTVITDAFLNERNKTNGMVLINIKTQRITYIIISN